MILPIKELGMDVPGREMRGEPFRKDESSISPQNPEFSGTEIVADSVQCKGALSSHMKS
jgi:hypothetical protein